MDRPDLRVACLLAALGALAACRKEEIQVYRLAKEGGSATAAPASKPAKGGELPEGHPPPAAPDREPPGPAASAGGGLHWHAPKGWTELPASGMRRASFRVPGAGGEADLSVVLLPGEAGGTLPNINRWRGQMGLEPMTDKQLAAQSQKVSTRVGPVLVVDFTGKDGKTKLLAGILLRPEESWFFKLTGDVRTVGPAKPSFQAFLKSLHESRS